MSGIICAVNSRPTTTPTSAKSAKKRREKLKASLCGHHGDTTLRGSSSIYVFGDSGRPHIQRGYLTHIDVLFVSLIKH